MTKRVTIFFIGTGLIKKIQTFFSMFCKKHKISLKCLEIMVLMIFFSRVANVAKYEALQQSVV